MAAPSLARISVWAEEIASMFKDLSPITSGDWPPMSTVTVPSSWRRSIEVHQFGELLQGGMEARVKPRVRLLTIVLADLDIDIAHHLASRLMPATTLRTSRLVLPGVEHGTGGES
jgi:hypothetical protein